MINGDNNKYHREILIYFRYHHHFKDGINWRTVGIQTMSTDSFGNYKRNIELFLFVQFLPMPFGIQKAVH